jgi:hypothetical protein
LKLKEGMTLAKVTATDASYKSRKIQHNDTFKFVGVHTTYAYGIIRSVTVVHIRTNQRMNMFAKHFRMPDGTWNILDNCIWEVNNNEKTQHKQKA